MNLSIGIVGLPNVGKSTLFNALLKKQQALAANYPFATIEPNVGVVDVPDSRLPVLAGIVNTDKIVPAIVEFYDIAGLVRGASTGEGLGNKFLSHIREVSVIVQVVRLFEDGDVIHVANKVDPASDIQVVETELMLADLETLKKQYEPKQNATDDQRAAYEVVLKLRKLLDEGVLARDAGLTDEEIELIRPLQLLTMKPQIYLFNVSEDQLGKKDEVEEKIKAVFTAVGKSTSLPHLFLNAKLENDVLAFSPEEQKEYLAQYDLTETGLNRLIQETYKALGLMSYLTAGVKEVRAWTIPVGTIAPRAAAAIHTDFEKHFIKADIVKYDDFVACSGWVKARETGKVVSAGRDYIMHDGDVVEFKVGV